MVLAAVAVTLVWVRIASLHHPKTQAGKPMTDLGVTMPLTNRAVAWLPLRRTKSIPRSIRFL